MANAFDAYDDPPSVKSRPSNAFDAYDDPAPSPSSAPQAPGGLLRDAALAGSALTHGLANTLGLPGDFEQWITAPKAQGYRTLPTSGELLAWTQSHGLTDRPDLIPQTTGERYLSAGSEGLGSAMPMLAMGAGIPSLGARLINLAAGAGGGLASQGVQDMGLPSWMGPAAGAGIGALLSGAHGLATLGRTSSPMIHGIGGLFGGDLGYHIGDIVAAMGGFPPRASAAIGGIAGMLLPSAIRGVSSAVRNPAELTPLAVGAMGGANPLFGPTPQAQAWPDQTQWSAPLP